MSAEPNFSVSQFVSVFNQTLELAYPTVIVSGELANFRISKNRWVYFDLKDDQASLRCFGTVYQLPGPLENGMLLTVRAQPRLHPLYNFSLNVQSIQVSGEGSLKRAADLLAAKLQAEGLFETERKRSLPYPPQRIGLIASVESAAYVDFTKILAARWGGLTIDVIDVQVQGEAAGPQLIRAIERFNAAAQPPDVLVLTRGGGSADDLAVFSIEPVVRAVAASRIPTLVAIGHEIDISLAELAADVRASTPSNAAELLVPDRREVVANLQADSLELKRLALTTLKTQADGLRAWQQQAQLQLSHSLAVNLESLAGAEQLLAAYSPEKTLARGYAIVRQDGQVVRQTKQLKDGEISLQFADGQTQAILKRND